MAKKQYFNPILEFLSGSQREKLENGWDLSTQTRFNAEFPAATTEFNLLCTKQKKPQDKLFQLLEIWKNCSDGVINARKKYSFLEKLYFIKTHKDGKIIEHLLGEVGQGGHFQEEGDKVYPLTQTNQTETHIYIEDATGTKVLIADLRQNPANLNSQGVLQLPAGHSIAIAQYARVKTEKIEPRTISRHILKNTPHGHTFFPHNLTLDEVLEQCASAWNNPQQNPWLIPPKLNRSQAGNLDLEAISENGLTIRWWQQNGEPNTFFPKF